MADSSTRSKGGSFSCPFSSFYFLAGRWPGGRACDKIRAGQAGTNGADPARPNLVAKSTASINEFPQQRP